MKSPERIALFTPSLRGGGAERMMVNLAAGLAGVAGVSVDLVAPNFQGPLRSHIDNRVRLIDLRARRISSSFIPLVRYLRNEEPRVLLSTLAHANMVALWARSVSGSKARVVIREANTLSQSVRASQRRARLVPHLAKLVYPHADAVVAVSQGVADDLAEWANIDPARISVILNPTVHPGLFVQGAVDVNHAWLGEGSAPVLVSMGRLTYQKDFQTLIRAFAIVNRELSCRLLIIGEGEEREALERLIQELDLEGRVQLLGFIENPYPYLRRASALISTSRYEGLPNAIIEAIALGTPVAATDCPSGPREILKDGELGPLCGVGDIMSIAQGIRTVLTAPVSREVLQERGSEFSVDLATRRYLEVLLPSIVSTAPRS